MAEGMVAESQNGGEGMAVERHELEHPWSFWFDNPSAKTRSGPWGSSLRKICTFSTVEEFWQFYNNLFVPSKLPPNADFHLFKEGIEPKWEDPSCAHGGKWTVANTKGKAVLDQIWLNTLLAMIGEQFDEGDDICGVVVSVRPRGDRIAIWTRSASNEAAQMSIGRQWKEFIDSSERIGYVYFEDAKKEKTPKNKYTV